jgi:uncharacterized membrane protein HdeD (DUF308 family)
VINALSGLLTTLIGLIVAFVPSRQVNSIWIFEGKLIAGCLIVFGAALFFYRRALRKTPGSSLSGFPAEDDLPADAEYGS